MADTVESLRADIDLLRHTLTQFMNYANPVIEAHQPAPKDLHIAASTVIPLKPDWLLPENDQPRPQGNDIPTPPGMTWPPNAA
jgi:hypothetical protein